MSCKKCGHQFNWNDMKDANGAANRKIFLQAEKEIKKILLPTTTTQVFISTLEGKTISFECSLQQDVLTVMKFVSQRTRIEVADQRLIFGGKQLVADRKLEDYGISSFSTLHLTMRLPGG